jgi:hypothetical protein
MDTCEVPKDSNISANIGRKKLNSFEACLLVPCSSRNYRLYLYFIVFRLSCDIGYDCIHRWKIYCAARLKKFPIRFTCRPQRRRRIQRHGTWVSPPPPCRRPCAPLYMSDSEMTCLQCTLSYSYKYIIKWLLLRI